MRRYARGLGGALLGALYAAAAAALAGRSDLVPAFPAHGGEDDFTVRFALFAGLVVPAFAALGAWLALREARARAIGGVVAATLVTFATAGLLAPAIATIETREAANAGVAALFLAWVLPSALAAAALRRPR